MLYRFYDFAALTVMASNLVFFGIQSAQAQGLIPMELYWSDRRQDSLATATKAGKQEAVGIGYDFVRVEACVFPTSQPKTIPLNLYRQTQTGENWTAINPSGSGGYSLKRLEGYIYPTPVAGTIPLNLYWNAKKKDYLTVATTEGMNRAKRKKYKFMKIQGYVFPAGYCR